MDSRLQRIRAERATADRETSWRYRGWRAVLACFVMATFAWGFGFYGQGVFLAELARLHSWPSSLVSTASTCYYLAGALLVAFVGDIISRIGPQAMVLAGTACFGVSVLSLAVVAAPWQLFAAYLLMAFGWATTSLGAINNILKPWFDRRLGLAISLSLNGASFGGVVLAPLLVLLVGWIGFGGALLAAVGAMLAILTPMTILWLGDPGGFAASHPPGFAGAPQEATANTVWTRRAALRSAHFWSVTAPFALALMAQVGFIVHLIAFLDPIIGHAQAGFALGLTSIAALIGRLALGVFVDRLDQRLATATALATQAGALVAMTQTTNSIALLAACAIYGLSVGNLITLPSLIIRREFEPAAFGLLTGLLVAISQFAYAFGPGLLGVLRDATGGYAVPLALCIALDLLAMAIILMGRRDRRQDS
jgi:MFS family permease